eukprot:COSAG06_NODE_3685_length_5014_cov_4.732452_2_plen_728_part_00
MAAAAPTTLEELAARAGIAVAELEEFEEDVFMQLLEEQAVNAVAKHRLRAQFRKLSEQQRASSAQAKFEAFYARVGGAGSLAGLQHVPVSTLPVALSFVEGHPGAPSEEALRAGRRVAYAKADALLAAGAEPHSLTRDELAAANMYTQDGWPGPQRSLFRPLNAALRSEARTDVKAYWGYIRLLQHALFKLPKDQSGVLFRGIKLDWPNAPSLADCKAELLRKQSSGEEEIWWGFSSTSTSLPAVRSFLGEDGPRVIFTVDGGSSARDVRRYSGFQEGVAVPEDERLLPCGTAFVVKTVDLMGEGLLMVSLRQTNDFLIQGGAPAEVPQLLEAVVPEPMEPEPEPQPALAAVCDMGFSEPDATEALAACGNDSAQAIEWLLARAAELEELPSAAPERVVAILARTTTVERVQAAGVQRLRVLSRDAALRGAIASAGGIGAVVRGMGQHPEAAKVQEDGCSALGSLARDAALRGAIASVGGIEAVVRGMGQHPEAAGVQKWGCGALFNLAYDAALGGAIASAGGIGAVVRGMGQHPEAVAVQKWGCAALAYLALDAALKGAIAGAGGIEAVVRGMGQHPEAAGVQDYGCNALANLALDAALKGAIAGAGGIEAVVRGMGQHPDAAGVQEEGCAVLWNLAANDAALRGAIGSAGGIEAVVRGMGQHPEAVGVQERGCGALRDLALDAALRGAIGSAGGIEALVRARRAFPTRSDKSVQRNADAALRLLR